jgi:hypothetical protein
MTTAPGKVLAVDSDDGRRVDLAKRRREVPD